MLDRTGYLIKKHCIETGEFILSSGARSSTYLDLSKLYLRGEWLEDLTLSMLDALPDKFSNNYEDLTLCGVPTGGQILATVLSKSYELDQMIIRVDKDLIEEPAVTKPRYPVLIIEDVVTTGNSILSKAYWPLIKAGFIVAGILCVVDREEGAAEKFAAMKIPFFSAYKLSHLMKTK